MLGGMPDDTKRNENAVKGGLVRAQRLTSEERSNIARQAAASRWGHQTRTATHVGEIKIGNIAISCAVLDDGTRVLSQAEFLEALGRHRKANVRREGSEERIPAILQGKAINPFISKDIL